MSTWYIIPSNSDLQHHGVLGQKWGVRRYQNKDGSYTSAGKIHYGEPVTKKEKKFAKKIVKNYAETLNTSNKYNKSSSKSYYTYMETANKLSNLNQSRNAALLKQMDQDTKEAMAKEQEKKQEAQKEIFSTINTYKNVFFKEAEDDIKKIRENTNLTGEEQSKELDKAFIKWLNKTNRKQIASKYADSCKKEEEAQKAITEITKKYVEDKIGKELYNTPVSDLIKKNPNKTGLPDDLKAGEDIAKQLANTPLYKIAGKGSQAGWAR